MTRIEIAAAESLLPRLLAIDALHTAMVALQD
jgi:hypothetical protein